MAIDVASEGYQPPKLGILLLYSLVALIFLLFVLRFWYLQILHGEEFAQKANANRIRLERVYATRGIIFDLHGRLLAENRPAYALSITREDCPDIPATLAQVSQWTSIPLPALRARFMQDRLRVKSFHPQIIATDVPFEKILDIEQKIHQWPGLSVETRQRRYYPHGPLFAHVLGYVAEANEQELREDSRLALGDIVGKQGLELVMENFLRDTKGQNSVEVDALGRPLNRRPQEPPQAGENLRLSLDIDLQQAASEALGEHAGAVVVLDPYSGKLRALVTHPSYDNNMFTTTLSRRDWAALVDDPRHPLQNRAIQSVYPPGSVWKLMMAGLFLEQNIDPRTTVVCRGQIAIGTLIFRCWRESGHGPMNMMQSLIHSCNVYYYEMAQRVGIDNMERFARASGFGRPTGIDLPHERSGIVPGREWKRRRFNESWQRGDTINASSGQGYTLVTPIQMAVFVAALINDGKILKPSLIENEPPEITGMLPIPAEHRSFILESMRLAVASGTAQRMRRPDAVMGGKTGTAQVGRLGERRLRTHELEYHLRNHAWLAAWGAKDGQTYVVVVMAEHGGGGGATAGPIVARVFEALFGPVPGSDAARRTAPPTDEEEP